MMKSKKKNKQSLNTHNGFGQNKETVMKKLNRFAILVAIMAIFTLVLPGTAMAAWHPMVQGWLDKPDCSEPGVGTVNFACNAKHKKDGSLNECLAAVKAACDKPVRDYTACEGQQSWLSGKVDPLPSNCACPSEKITKGKGTIAGKKNRPVCIASAISDKCFVKNDGTLGDDCKCGDAFTLNAETFSCDPKPVLVAVAPVPDKVPEKVEPKVSEKVLVAYFGELENDDPRVHGFCPADTHLSDGDQPSCLCDSDNETKVVHPANGSTCSKSYWAKILDYLGTPSSFVDLGLFLGILGIFLALWAERRKWACSCGTENSVLSKKCAHCSKARPPKPDAPVACPKDAIHPKGKPGTKCQCGAEYPKPEIPADSSGISREEMRETLEAIADSRIPEAIAEELSPLLAALEAGDMSLVADELSKLKADGAELAEAGLDDGDDDGSDK